MRATRAYLDMSFTKAMRERRNFVNRFILMKINA